MMSWMHFFGGLRIPSRPAVVALIFLVQGSLAFSTPGDTTRLTMAGAEQRFLNNNLQLLAGSAGVEASRAAIDQAGLWTNPNIAVEQNVYNWSTRRLFDVTRSGNTDIQLQQLFLLGGKRSHQVALAEVSAETAGYSLADIVRSLKLELRTDLYDLYFLRQSVTFYNESIATLKKTVDATERILENRSILLSDVLRLKSLLFSLETERLGLVNKVSDIEGDLRTLLRDTSSSPVHYEPLIDRAWLDSIRVDTLMMQAVVEAALRGRPDFQTAEANVRLGEANLALQKAIAIPDVTLGGHWSRAGSYIPDYYALTLSVDLPLFNRNQGNIRAAEKTLEQNRLLTAGVRQQVEREVETAYRKAAEEDALYRHSDRRFTEEYSRLMKGMVESYGMRNISLLQFTDFYESYRTSVIQLNQLQNDRADALEALNYAAGTDIVKVQ